MAKQAQTTTRRARRAGHKHLLISVPMHLAAVAILVAAAIWALLPQAHIELIYALRLDEGVREGLWAMVLQMTLVASLVWATVWFSARRYRRQRRLSLVRVMQRSRGSVMTEFLVILPLYLLLSFGLAQLTINLIGGLLHRVAQYQAMRTVWVWQPEAVHGRAGVDAGVVQDRVRVAVATVMAPVAPGSYGDYSLIAGGGDTSEAAASARAFMASRFTPAYNVPKNISDFVGGNVVGLGLNFLNPEPSFANAIDNMVFTARAILKFTHAYNVVSDVQVGLDGEELTVSYTYQMQQAMPYVGKFFGAIASANPLSGSSSGLIDGRPGYFVAWPGERTMTRQRCTDTENGNCPSNPTRPNS